MDPIVDASALIDERFPAARLAILGGGVLSGHRTATSDLDIVVVIGGPPAPYRESLRWRGWPVELFVHDETSLAAYIATNLAERKPTMARMCAEGAVLRDRDGLAERFRAGAAAGLAAGPAPLTEAELARYRYGLTDLLDDLAGAEDPGEYAFIVWHLAAATARLALLARRHWLGTGKWLIRELRAADPGLADRLVAALADPTRLPAVAHKVLAGVGGPLWDGFHEPGQIDG